MIRASGTAMRESQAAEVHGIKWLSVSETGIYASSIIWIIILARSAAPAAEDVPKPALLKSILEKQWKT